MRCRLDSASAHENADFSFFCPATLEPMAVTEGWYPGNARMRVPEALRSYGRYLGQRYRDFHNIIWVQGGDWDPPDKKLVDALAQGYQGDQS